MIIMPRQIFRRLGRIPAGADFSLGIYQAVILNVVGFIAGDADPAGLNSTVLAQAIIGSVDLFLFDIGSVLAWNRFLSVVQTDREGSRLNLVKVDGVDSTDEKVIGKRLQEIAKNATTGGLYKAVGELYGFPIKVVSERTLKEGLEFTDNRFVVEGNYKYTYNNGHLAMADPIAAARNFLNALERIPTIIDQYKSKNEVLEKEIPQLQEIAGKVWKKEDELKQLKSELAALDRKIQLELAPAQENTEENRQGNEKKQTEQQPESPHVDFVRSHLIIGRPGLSESKGVKL